MSIIAVALLAALNGAAPQEQATPRVESRSEIRIVTTGDEGPGRLDANGDGEVTRDEFSAPMGNAFDRLDTNNDGKLSTEELAASRPGPGGPDGPGRRFMMFGGPDGPGEHDFRIITRDGPDGPRGPMVFHGGGPGDVRVFTSRIDRDGPMPGGPGGTQVFVRRFGGPDGPGDMDKNGDGKVSQDEFLAPMIDAFQSMDADHDGFLDEGEGRPIPPPPPPAEGGSVS